MKATTIVKISPLIELASPQLLRCKTGECGNCPNNTGKLLWVPKKNAFDTSFSETFNFQYNFFNKAAESTSNIRYNVVDGNTTINGNTPSYSERPDKAWAVANNAIDISLSPSLMRGSSFLTNTFNFSGAGGWLLFRQPNPAISNVHDALCFEYSHEKRLITFRSF
jgi:hypothetical protein